ncbi:MAG: cyclohexanecarboxylate-CoA ligase [Betaproteobacteria bacterium]|nr:cyclohexanecarboxylate-CoA ligase [Betaproteobacteria bacterium]
MNTLLTLHNPSAASAYYATDVWQQDTMYMRLAHHAETRPDAFALRDSRRRLTWSELRRRVDAVALSLDAKGLRQGDRVCVWLPNRVEATIVFLACSRNGYVCNPSLHQNYTVAEVVTLMERLSAVALFAQLGYGADAKAENIFQRAKAVESLRHVFVLDAAATDGAHPFPEPNANVTPPPTVQDPDKIVYLAFTSGTTGRPKGVMHSDNTLLANGRAMVRDWHHDANTILYSFSPLSHHIATVGLEQMLVAGCEMVVNDPPAGKRPIDWIIASGATYVMGVPTHAIDIIAEIRSRGLQQLGAVKVFYMAGSTIPPATARSFLDLGIKPQNIYGMTENGSHQYTLPTDDEVTITSTCGKACHGYEVKIWHAENHDIEVGPGEIGEIGGRGGVLTLGYFDHQAATEQSFNRQGWFMSGDLGRFDANGNLEIVGRKKDMIIRGGRNIYPSQIEDHAKKHADIRVSAAIGVADERLGERVCLAIITASGAPLTGEAVLAHLAASGLSKYDMPEYYIQMDAFPLTASGKVLKRELIEWVKTGRIQPARVRWAPAKDAT